MTILLNPPPHFFCFFHLLHRFLPLVNTILSQALFKWLPCFYMCGQKIECKDFLLLLVEGNIDALIDPFHLSCKWLQNSYTAVLRFHLQPGAVVQEVSIGCVFNVLSTIVWPKSLRCFMLHPEIPAIKLHCVLLKCPRDTSTTNNN